MTRANGPRRRAAALLREFALAFPEAREDFPWGGGVVKVRGKVFVFLGHDEGDLGLSVKLPRSGMLALSLPFASPTGYGLGKAGWVTARFGSREKAPLDLLRAWIDESYRAVAPKRLLAALSPAEDAGHLSASGRTSARPTPRRNRKSR